MKLNPTARLLKLPAYAWVVGCLFLWINVYALGAPKQDSLPRPEEVAVIFQDPIVVFKKDTETFEIVPETERNKTPLWVVFPSARDDEVNNVEWLFGWDGKRFNLGLYRRHSIWKYTLSSQPWDRPNKQLSESELARIRPLLIDKLNTRFPEEQAGIWFDKVLETGIEETSYLFVQNFVIVAAWLSLLPALVAVVSMLAEPEGVVEPVNSTSGDLHSTPE
jgi:hypothetical protein